MKMIYKNKKVLVFYDINIGNKNLVCCCTWLSACPLPCPLFRCTGTAPIRDSPHSPCQYIVDSCGNVYRPKFINFYYTLTGWVLICKQLYIKQVNPQILESLICVLTESAPSCASPYPPNTLFSPSGKHQHPYWKNLSNPSVGSLKEILHAFTN